MGLIHLVLFTRGKYERRWWISSRGNFVTARAARAAHSPFRFVPGTINWACQPTNRYKRFDLECSHLAVE
jgi:hypothetical protein